MDGSDGPIASSSRSPASRLTRIHFTEEAGDSLNLEDSPGTQFKASRTTKRLTLMSALPIDNNMGARRRISSGPESRPSQPRRRKAASTSPSQKRYLFDQDSGFDSGPSKLNAFSDEYDLCTCATVIPTSTLHLQILQHMKVSPDYTRLRHAQTLSRSQDSSRRAASTKAQGSSGGPSEAGKQGSLSTIHGLFLVQSTHSLTSSVCPICHIIPQTGLSVLRNRF